MAVCQIWDVRGRLDKPLNYATNKEKTTALVHKSEELQGLRDVMDYASNSKKTHQSDEQRFLSSINCNILTARQDMLLTKKQWNDTRDIVAFHGFQSFKPEEVTPEIAHEIGVRLAEKMWGSRFEVVIATHLNTDCLHNHFVINATSFKDGKRFYDNKEHLKKFRYESDQLCKEYQLSVIEHPDTITSPRYLYKADAAGMPTRYNVLKSAIDDAIAHSFTQHDFFKQMSAMGYRCDFRESRKYATIIPKGYEKPIRIHKLGSDYSRDAIYERIQSNRISVKSRPIPKPIHTTSYRTITPSSLRVAKKKGGLQGLYLHYCYLLGIIPKGSKRNAARMHYLLKEDLLKLDRISRQVQLLYTQKINHVEQLHSYKQQLESEQSALISKRKSLWNKTRTIYLPDQMKEVKDEIAHCSKRLKQIRQDLKSLDSIVERTPIIEKNLRIIEQEQLSNEKENSNHALLRRRSRTDRTNEP